MEQTAKKQYANELSDILAANPNLREDLAANPERWSVAYNKKADMLIMGTAFPAGSFYYPVGNTRVMLRIDEQKNIYGFAIENAKYFAKENPEIGFALFPIIYPIRTRLFVKPFYMLMHHTLKSLDKVHSILTMADYISSRRAFAS